MWLDIEHGSLDLAELRHLIRVADAVGAGLDGPRCDHQPSLIQRVLDLGAAGIMVPHVRTVEEAQSVAAAVRYGPARLRGACPAADHFYGRPLRFDAVTEYVGIATHGSNTHLDGLGHYSWEGPNHNGFLESDTTSRRGATSLSVHHAAHRFIVRGVLLDIAGLHGVRWLDRGYAVAPDELAAAERRRQVRVRAGDALLIHMGNVAAILTEGATVSAQRPARPVCMPAVPYLRERDIAVLGNDGISDVQISGSGLDLIRTVHIVALVAIGLWLIDDPLRL